VLVQIPAEQNAADPGSIPIHTLYDDGQLLCLDKQPGIVVHPVGGHMLDNLLSALHARYRDHDDPALDRVPHVCHRIDKETSGVFLVAFDGRLKARVSRQFEERTVRKEYLALVHGVPAEPEGEIEAPIRYVETDYPRLSVHPDGLPSRTDWRTEESFGDAALVRFFPRTGRTHQIRLHAAHIGHPLLCDYTYGGRRPILRSQVSTPGAALPPPAPASLARPYPPTGAPGPVEKPLLDRCALHAARLELVHPGTGEEIVFEAPLPADLRATAAFLRARPAAPGGVE
jgi:23S rRNA pseudouridine1911/1915/1917 synthase